MSAKIIEADRIPGMMPAPQLAWFATQAMTRNSIVEVGCWKGRTTRGLVDNCPGTVFAIDTFEGSPELMDELTFMQQVTRDEDWLWHEFMRCVGAHDNLRVIRSSSLEAAKHFKDLSVEMVILDAAHDYASVCADIKAWWPKVTVEGLLCGHDFNHHEVYKAVCDCIPTFPKKKDGEDTANIWRVIKGKPGEKTA